MLVAIAIEASSKGNQYKIVGDFELLKREQGVVGKTLHLETNERGKIKA